MTFNISEYSSSRYQAIPSALIGLLKTIFSPIRRLPKNNEREQSPEPSTESSYQQRIVATVREINAWGDAGTPPPLALKQLFDNRRAQSAKYSLRQRWRFRSQEYKAFTADLNKLKSEELALENRYRLICRTRGEGFSG